MKEKLALRPMRIEDIPIVVALERVLFPEPWTENMFRKEIEDHFFSFPWVLQDSDGGVIGYIVLWIILEELHIATIGVSPEWQGKGLGKLLMAWALFWGKEMGAEVATLEVRPSNKVAVSLYSGLGFQVVGRRKKYYTNKEDALIMTKEFLDEEEIARTWEESQRNYDLLVKEEPKWENSTKLMTK